jgi:hypothetical protein
MRPQPTRTCNGKLASNPPARLAPCRGDVVEAADLKDRLASVLWRRM